MELLNTTELEKKDFKEINNKSSKGLLKVMLFTTICFLLILVATIFTKETIEIVCCCVTGIISVVLILSYILFKIKVNKNLKNVCMKVVYNYKFLDDYFDVEVVTENQKGNSEMKYESLLKYEETKEYIYLYITNISFYIIKKENFKEDYSPLIETLKAKINKK